MAVEDAVAASGQEQRSWLARAWASSRFWRWWLLAAAVLLAASEVLWLWHSWTARELLDSEPPVAGSRP